MIFIRESKAEKIPGNINAFVSFNYDPQIVDFLHAFPSKNFNKKTKEWEIPLSRVPFLIDLINEDFEITLSEDEETKEIIKIPENYQFKTKPFPHQIEAIEYGLNHDNWILGDAQGLGKSLSSINIACILKYLGKIKHCLVICGVNSLKWNWLSEIEKHSYEKGHILGSRYNRKNKLVIDDVKSRVEDLKHIDEDTLFLITNIETLRNNDFVDTLKKADIDMIIVDEIHKAKSSTSDQGKNLIKTSFVKYKIALTGTMIMNSPLDAYTPLKWLGIEKSNLTNFKQYYCVFGGFGNHQVIGYRNLPLMQNQLKENMLRRLKKDTLDLPPKIHKIEYVEMGEKQRKLYESVRDEILSDMDILSDFSNPLSKLLRLRQITNNPDLISPSITENAKFERIKDYVEEITKQGDKCVIFSNWEETTKRLREYLKEYKPKYVAGKMEENIIVEEINKFQNDPKYQVMIGTTGKLGTGWTLTAGTYVLFVDDPWTKAMKDQAEDRCYRIGTKGTVNIITFVCKDTIDEEIEDVISKKGAIAELTADGVIPKEKHKEVINYLVKTA